MIRLTSLILILIGLYGIFSSRNVIKILVGVNIMELGVNIFIVSVGFVSGGLAPILTAGSFSSAMKFVDPLPQALVLTSIVIGLGITALGLVFARKIHQKYGTYDLNDIGGESDD